jgi:hypothetical protein
MNRKALRKRWLGVLAALLGLPFAYGQVAAPGGATPTWETLAATQPAGLDASRWQRLVSQLKDGGLSPESADPCLDPAREAARLGLPAESILTRLEEGLAKRAEPNALLEATRLRLLNLQKAASVLRQAGYENRSLPDIQLLNSATLALESGLPADTLLSVLTRAGDKQPERMRVIVEAGETMCLNHMDAATVAQIMTDFAERNMRRTEILRASRFAVQQNNDHVEGTRIRQRLWTGDGSGKRTGAGANITSEVTPGTEIPASRGTPGGNATPHATPHTSPQLTPGRGSVPADSNQRGRTAPSTPLPRSGAQNRGRQV